MIEPAFWTRFLVAALAVWRVTHLLAREDGPWDVVVRVRRRMGHGFWGRLLDCFYCLSMWTAAAAAPLVTTAWPDLAVTWLALSGAACLLERIGEPPLVMHSLTTAQEEEEHGVLRKETGGSGNSFRGGKDRP